MINHSARLYRLDLIYAATIAVLAAVAFAGAVWAKAAPYAGTRIDISELMANVDVASLPVHDIKDAF
jgi:hypothetical protein